MPAQLDSDVIRIAPGRALARLIGYLLFEGRPLTTKGRWWNPVVFFHLRRAAKWNRGHRVDRPVFIVGMGRSGTTLLGRILAAHPLVGFLNEPKAMWHVIRDDEDIIGSYASRPGRLYLDRSDASDAVTQRATSLFSWYLTASRSRRLVDKYPELIFRHEFVRAIFPDARFLIAIREPFAALRSVARWSDSHRRDGADWWGLDDLKWRILWSEGVVAQPANADLAELELSSEADDGVRAAVEWLVTAREALELIDGDPAASVVVYERLAGDPRGETRAILEACELPPSPRTEAYAATVVEPSRPAPSGEVAPLPEKLTAMLEQTGALVAQRLEGSALPAGRAVGP